MKLGRQRNCYKGRVALRHYANQPGESPSRGILRDCEIFANFRLIFNCSSSDGVTQDSSITRYPALTTLWWGRLGTPGLGPGGTMAQCDSSQHNTHNIQHGTYTTQRLTTLFTLLSFDIKEEKLKPSKY